MEGEGAGVAGTGRVVDGSVDGSADGDEDASFDDFLTEWWALVGSGADYAIHGTSSETCC